MMRSANKRQLEYDEDNTTAKFPRLEPGRRFVSLPTFSPFARRSIPSFDQTASQENAASSSLNRTQPDIGSWTRERNTEKTDRNVDSQIRINMTPQANPFTYQPLEDYKRAEALRVVFLKHGLDHKRPHSDISLFNTENLSEYVKQWEDCFNHWYPIMGAEPSEAILKRKSSTFNGPGFPYQPFSMNMEGETDQELEPTEKSSTEDFAMDDLISDGSTFASESIFSQSSPFKPTVPLWARTESVQEKVRQMVETEVRKLFDNPDFRIRQPSNSQQDDDGQGTDADNASEVAPDQDAPQ